MSFLIHPSRLPLAAIAMFACCGWYVGVSRGAEWWRPTANPNNELAAVSSPGVDEVPFSPPGNVSPHSNAPSAPTPSTQRPNAAGNNSEFERLPIIPRPAEESNAFPALPPQPVGNPDRHDSDNANLPSTDTGRKDHSAEEAASNSSSENAPSPFTDDVDGDFPPLPPIPDVDAYQDLRPLEEEIIHHGGSYLYHPEGDQIDSHCHADEHEEKLRLPEGYQKPRPLTLFSEFLGADPINVNPNARWPGLGGYVFDKRFVAYGGYSLFGFALNQNNQQQNLIGQQLLVELDYRLTGTERFHVQFRPLGEGNTGGSYYQFTDPEGYVSNATGVPDRYWFEGEVNSVFGAYTNPFKALDLQVVGGKFPFQLHNSLLMSDDILGVAVNKNTLLIGQNSNMNVQAFYGSDVDRPTGDDNSVFGTHISVDRHHTFYEFTYAYLDSGQTSDAHYFAASCTKFIGVYTLSGRAFARVDSAGGAGNGELFVLEANRDFIFDHKPLGVEHAVAYANAFWVEEGWSPISGGNFNRLRTAFEVNPLVSIASGQIETGRWGVAVGAQLFRHHEDESLTPEFAFESPDGQSVFGLGLRYQRATGKRSFFEVLSLINFSDDPQYERRGVFAAETILF